MALTGGALGGPGAIILGGGLALSTTAVGMQARRGGRGWGARGGAASTLQLPHASLMLSHHRCRSLTLPRPPAATASRCLSLPPGPRGPWRDGHQVRPRHVQRAAAAGFGGGGAAHAHPTAGALARRRCWWVGGPRAVRRGLLALQRPHPAEGQATVVLTIYLPIPTMAEATTSAGAAASSPAAVTLLQLITHPSAHSPPLQCSRRHCHHCQGHWRRRGQGCGDHGRHHGGRPHAAAPTVQARGR